MSEREKRAHVARSLAKGALIAVLWLVVWQLVALLVDNQWLLSGPLEAAQAWAQLALASGFWLAIGNSLLRIAIGFLVAFIAGVVLGYLAAKLPLLRDAIEPLVTVVKSTPVVCIIALLLVGTGANAATSIVVGLVVFPQFYHAVIEALAEDDRSLDEALCAFGVPSARVALYVEFAALGSSLRAACAIAAGLAWKSGIAAELIGLPALSIGTGVYLGKIALDSAAIIAWTATVILLSWASEKLLLALVDLLLRIPRLALSRHVEHALEADGSNAGTIAKESMAADLPTCGLVIEELRRVHPSARGRDAKPLVLEYEGIAIAPGERVCVMAPSGAGKTTLLRIVAQLDMPDAGGISFVRGDRAREGSGARNDADLASERSEHPTASVVMQASTLLEWATPLENVALVARDDAEVKRGQAYLREVLDESDLEKPASALSGGMKRRAELCRALAHEGELLVLDEPFAGLDDATKLRCVELMRRALRGRTLLVATHDANDASLLDAKMLTL